MKRTMDRHVLLLVLIMLGVQSEAFTYGSAFASSRRRSALLHSRPPFAATKQSSTELSALLDPSIVTSLLTEESIHDAFSVATFLPQPFWLLLILIPNNGITKKIMGGMGTYVNRLSPYALTHK